MSRLDHEVPGISASLYKPLTPDGVKRIAEAALEVLSRSGTAVFAIYVADALGYTGTISVMLYSDLFAGDVSRLHFFEGLTYLMSMMGIVLSVAACSYFLYKSRSPGADHRTGRVARRRRAEPSNRSRAVVECSWV